jgi:glycosyltransferase involved in cell wall biosynthesis
MPVLPRISIVTACLGPTASLIETVESVARQGYTNLEHFVVTSSSRDGIGGFGARHPQVALVSDPGRGRASALNIGFSLASGAIWAILDAGDCLVPGALDVVAREIDRGHHVVMGRCRVRDARGRLVGIEHPSAFESHLRVLEIWRGHTVPRPAVFWAAEVWRTCGPMDESVAPAWLDYDLCCRFSRSYRFHRVDQVLAMARLRLHAGNAPTIRAEALDAGIAVSRRYWGSALRPMRWRLALSLWRYSLDRVARARRHVGTAKEKRRSGGGRLYIGMHAAAAILLAPKVAFYVGAYPALRERAGRLWGRALVRVGQWGKLSPTTTGYLEHTEAWSDGWVGPRLVVTREVDREARVVGVTGSADLQHMTKPLILTVRLNGRVIGRHRVRQPGDFVVRIPLTDPLPPGVHTVGVEASTWFVPDGQTGSGDLRPLAWRLGHVAVDGVTHRSSPGPPRT